MPTYYYYGCKFVPQYDDLLIMYAYHIVPQDKEYVVRTCKFGENAPNDDFEGSFSDIYPHTKDKKCSFNLLKTKGRHGTERIQTLYLDI